MTDTFYRAFEDRYRGPRELIKSRLRVYLPFVEPLKAIYQDCKAVDLGCGRGEWLELLREWGFDATGVDLDDGMLAACRALGLPAEQGEAIAFLRSVPDASVMIVSGFHIAEHIPFSTLQTLVQEALRVLRPAGLLILETPNPENLTVGTAKFYYDPTHQRPLPPPLLSFLSEHYGFARIKILRLQEPPGLVEPAPVSLMDVFDGVSPDYAVVAQKAAEFAEQSSLFDKAFQRHYGLELEALAMRHENALSEKLSEILSRVDRSAELEARVNAAEAEFAQAQEQLSQTQAELSQTQAELSQTGQQLTARAAETEWLKAHIAALRASTSWRVTAPLRLVSSSAQATKHALARMKLRFKVWLKPHAVRSLTQPPATRTAVQKMGRWIFAHPSLERLLESSLRDHPRLARRLKWLVLGQGAAPAHVDQLMLRIEDEVARWRSGGNSCGIPRHSG